MSPLAPRPAAPSPGAPGALREATDAARRIATIIWGALAASPLVLAVVFLAVVPPFPSHVEILGVIGAAFAVLAAALSHLVPRFLKYPPHPGSGTTRVIIGSAWAEGGALFGIVCHKTSGDLLALAGAVVAWAALLAHFPSPARFDRLAGFGEPGYGTMAPPSGGE